MQVNEDHHENLTKRRSIRLWRSFCEPRAPFEKIVTRTGAQRSETSRATSRRWLQQLAKTLDMQPAAVIDEVKKSSLAAAAGRFPTGLKWTSCQGKPEAQVLCINADESEGGTAKELHSRE